MSELGEWKTDGWWRVLGPDGALWCETSVESEARDSMRSGDSLEQRETITFARWQQRYVKSPAHKLSCPARQRNVACTCGVGG